MSAIWYISRQRKAPGRTSSWERALAPFQINTARTQLRRRPASVDPTSFSRDRLPSSVLRVTSSLATAKIVQLSLNNSMNIDRTTLSTRTHWHRRPPVHPCDRHSTCLPSLFYRHLPIKLHSILILSVSYSCHKQLSRQYRLLLSQESRL